ncbi:MAG: hypothetical protein ACWGMZ_10310 [Thermoguttaceae bacterium]
MTSEELALLKATYTGQSVIVKGLRPELARWTSRSGRVITVNCNGRALVQFDGPEQAWHDFDPEYLQIHEACENQS